MQRGLGPSLRGVGALAADFYLRTGYMPLRAAGDAAAARAASSSTTRADPRARRVRRVARRARRSRAAAGARQPRRRASSSSPSTAPAATRSSREGGYVTGRGRAAARRGDADADRRGGAHRPVPDAAVLAARRSPTGSSTRSSATSLYAKHPGRPRRLGDRPHRPGPGGPRDVVHRRCRARRLCIADRAEAADVSQREDWLVAGARAPARPAATRPRSDPARGSCRRGRRTRAPSSPSLALLGLAALARARLRRRLRVRRASRTRRSCSASRSGSRSSSSRRRCIVIGKRLVADRGAGGGLPAARASRRSRRRSRELVDESGSRFTRAAALQARPARRRRRARRSRSLTPARLARPALPTSARSSRRRGGAAAGSSTSTAGRRGADDIEEGTFYTAFPEGADRGADRRAARPRPPRPRRSCTCRRPARLGAATGSSPTRRSARTRAARSRSTARRRSRPTSRGPALVCPCHYSTFDPRDRRHGPLRPGRAAAAAAAALDRRARLPAGRGQLHGAGRARRGGASGRSEHEA